MAIVKSATRIEQPKERVKGAVDEKVKVDDVIANNRKRQKYIHNLESKILTLAANINAAKYQWLVLLAEFDRIDGWGECDDAGSTAKWLSFKCGITPGAARENVRVARALTELPAISAEFKAGRLSYSKVRAMTRAATPENEDYLVMIARHGTGAHMEKLVRLRARTMRLMDPDLSQRVYESRGLDWRTDEDGSVIISARLTPDQADVIIGVIQRISTELQDESAAEVEKTDPAGYREGSYVRVVNVEQRRTQHRADAFERLAQGWLLQRRQAQDSESQGSETQEKLESQTHKSEQTGQSANPTGSKTETQPATRAGENARSHRHRQVTGGDTHTMVVHVDVAALSHSPAIQACDMSLPVSKRSKVSAETADTSMDDLKCACHSDYADDTADKSDHQTPMLNPPVAGVSAATLSRIGCDTALIASIDDADGNPLNIGRRRRSIPPAIRRALQARDSGCTFPGCSHDQFVDAHHIQHWCNGGETRLDNLILLCRRHHRLIHEGGYGVTMSKGHRPVFYSPKGNPIKAPEDNAGAANGSESVAAINRANGIHVNPTTVQTLWDGVRPDWSTMVEGTLPDG